MNAEQEPTRSKLGQPMEAKNDLRLQVLSVGTLGKINEPSFAYPMLTRDLTMQCIGITYCTLARVQCMDRPYIIDHCTHDTGCSRKRTTIFLLRHYGDIISFAASFLMSALCGLGRTIGRDGICSAYSRKGAEERESLLSRFFIHPMPPPSDCFTIIRLGFSTRYILRPRRIKE
jgi:hypothetical protein